MRDRQELEHQLDVVVMDSLNRYLENHSQSTPTYVNIEVQFINVRPSEPLMITTFNRRFKFVDNTEEWVTTVENYPNEYLEDTNVTTTNKE